MAIKGRRKIITIILFLASAGSVSIFGRAFSYDTNIAHPNITDLAAKIYNNNASEKLTEQEIAWLKQGSIEEDTPIRWMNHFYDPITGKGVSYFGRDFMNAKDWSQDPNEQKKYILGDYSWDRIIYDYQKGNKKDAFVGLGHIIHLVSDMAVPAHTRNDPHELGDSYEQFVKENYDLLAKGLDSVQINEYYFDNINSYFANLAKYSNNNFYSDNDIFITKFLPKYDLPVNDGEIGIIVNGKMRYYMSNKDIKGLLLYIKKSKFDRSLDDYILNDPYILTDYTKHLFPRAAGYSAGVIKLFFEEVKKEHNFSFNEKRANGDSALNYLVAYAFEKAIKFFGGVDIDLGKVKADENTVTKVMNENVVENAIAQEENPEQNNFLESATFSVALQPEQSAVNEDVVEQNLVQPISVPELPVDIISKPPKDEPPLLRQDFGGQAKQEEHISGPHFVFGPGGEQNPPEQASTPAPATQLETALPEITSMSTTSTEEIIDIATSTAPITEEEITTSTEEIIETITSTEPIIEEPFDSAQDETEIVEEDVTAPDQSSLVLVQNISNVVTSTVQLSWNSTSEDVSFYDLEYQNNGEWQILFSQTTSTSYTMDVEKFKTYTFRANATDINSNISDWTEKSITIDYSKSVVINEIAWMGTASNKSSDEWLELYNNTDENINLAGWKIKVSGNYLTWNNTSSSIKARDYYLLERTNDNTVSDFSADGIFTLSGGLKNIGENLILLNNNGDIIDQVDNSGGWFAGQTGTKYKTMERINSNNPGTQAGNWQTSDTFSVKGKGQGGVRIYGTPKQPNQGYWYLQNLTTNYTFDENKTLTLTEENSPYFIDDKTEIPAGYTLKLKEGVVIAGASNSSNLIVKGNLIIEGTSEKPVIFTSARDTNYLAKNYSNLSDGNPEAGDWSRIEVSENGKLNVNNVKFFYGGQKYFAQGGFVFGGKFPARIINNLGGEVSLDNAFFQNNFIRTDGTDQTYDAIIWIEPANGLFATTTINNSVFDGGYLAIKNQKQNNYNSISNSFFKNFTNPIGPITSRYDLLIMENNIFENNARNVVEIQQFAVNKDMVLDPNAEYIMGGITIDAGATLQISPGVIINLENKSSIAVNGSLEAIGTENNKIIIRPANTAEQWGNIIFNNSTSTLEYADITGGNNGSFNMPQNNGMLWMKDSNVILNNVFLADARRPYNMIYSKDSNLKMTDSAISWSTPKESKSWTVDGINLDGGFLYLNNTTFNQMDRGIEMYNFAAIETENMTLGHFTNISDLNWWPVNAIGL